MALFGRVSHFLGRVDVIGGGNPSDIKLRHALFCMLRFLCQSRSSYFLYGRSKLDGMFRARFASVFFVGCAVRP